MSEVTTLEIVEIYEKGEKTSPKTGRAYWIARVKDGRTGRNGTAFGAWVKGWKVTDTIEVKWEENDYNGKKSWNIVPPVEKKPSFSAPSNASSSSVASTTVNAWLIAAQLIPVMAFKTKGSMKLAEIEEFVNVIKTKLEGSTPVTVQPSAPVETVQAPVHKVETVTESIPAPSYDDVDEEIEEDDKPF